MFWEEYECSQERNQILTFVTADIQKIIGERSREF